jgi:putative PIN family toxin of toxin-antitoxin system
LALFTSAELLGELLEVLEREKFSPRLKLAAVSPRELVLGYAALARIVRSAPVRGVVVADPDDDLVIACAVSAQADLIVSGDSHLLELRRFQGIRILSASAALLEL